MKILLYSFQNIGAGVAKELKYHDKSQLTPDQFSHLISSDLNPGGCEVMVLS